MTKNRATFELSLAGALWGLGFVAAVWALEKYTPHQVLILRFLLAFVAGEMLRFAWTSRQESFLPKLWELKLSLGSGFFLGLLLLFQTIGLQTTTASKSGFLTSLYVVIVPLLNTFLFKKFLSWAAIACVSSALIGMVMIVGPSFEDWVVGDLWTLLCALFAAAHIMYIGHQTKVVSQLRPLVFNNYQNLTALLLICFLLDRNDLTLPTLEMLPVLGILILGLGGSLLAFTIQIRTQKYLSDTTASMIFLLESPFAFIFAWLLLNEKMTSTQILGAVLILIGSVSIHFVTKRSDA